MDTCADLLITSAPARRRYLVVGSLGMLFSGIIYGWSILKAPMMEAFGWTASEMAVNYTLTMCFFCLGSLLTGLLLQKVSVKLLLVAAGMLVCAGFVMSARMGGHSVWELYIFYGMAIGFGSGLSYNTLLSVVGMWYPDKKGFCSGTMMMSFGLSAMLLGQACVRLFSSLSTGWRGTFIWLGIAALFVMIFCAMVFQLPPSHIKSPEHPGCEKRANENVQREYTASEVVHRPAFWIFYLYGTLGTTVGSVVFSFAYDLAVSMGAQLGFATILVGLLTVFNGIGRVICGLLFDHIGREKTMLAAGMLTVAAPLCMLTAILLQCLPLGLGAFCMTGISYGCYPTISASVIASFYGTKHFSINYSISNTKLLLSSFSSIFATALMTQTGSFVAPFLVLLGFAVAALCLGQVIRQP